MTPALNYFTSFFAKLFIAAAFALLTGCFDSTAHKNESETLTMVPLNDTGAVMFTKTFASSTTDPLLADLLSNVQDSSAIGQDADTGRDITLNNPLDGSYGFQFTKLDQNGDPLIDQAAIYQNTPWACVKDNVTGLIWEVKTTSGLQNSQNTYSWYEPDSSLNGGFEGLPGNDTHAYAQAINSLDNGKGLCGLTGWRLPLREELRSIVDYGSQAGAAVDLNYFPNASDSDTWTSQTSYYRSVDGSEAWEIHFDTGKSESHLKSSDSVNVRLVHSPL